MPWEILIIVIIAIGVYLSIRESRERHAPRKNRPRHRMQ